MKFYVDIHSIKDYPLTQSFGKGNRSFDQIMSQKHVIVIFSVNEVEIHSFGVGWYIIGLPEGEATHDIIL